MSADRAFIFRSFHPRSTANLSINLPHPPCDDRLLLTTVCKSHFQQLVPSLYKIIVRCGAHQ